MVRSWLLVPVLLAALLASARPASAHGGVYRGPGGIVPPGSQALRCDCARIDCKFCSARGLASLQDVSRRLTSHRVVNRWGDLVEVETRIRFETRRERGFVEGHAAVRHAPLFAAVAGSVEIGDQALTTRLLASAAARRDYLWERRQNKDPLLVLRMDASRVRLRVFPISRARPTFAVVRGYALSDDLGHKGVRAYRSGTRFLVVVPLDSLAQGTKADFADPGGNRALFFLDEAAARKRFGKPVDGAVEVPCVAALASAVFDKGVDAVTKHAALIAVPKGGGAPKGLTVGSDSAPVPPPSPPPPPPPPTQAQPSRPAPVTP